jgi:hypothetical protein
MGNCFSGAHEASQPEPTPPAPQRAATESPHHTVGRPASSTHPTESETLDDRWSSRGSVRSRVAPDTYHHRTSSKSAQASIRPELPPNPPAVPPAVRPRAVTETRASNNSSRRQITSTVWGTLSDKFRYASTLLSRRSSLL